MPLSVTDYSLSGNGKTIVFSTSQRPAQESAGEISEGSTAGEARGYRIPFGKGSDDVSTREYAIYSARIESGKLLHPSRLYFRERDGVRRRSTLRGVAGLNLSPDGRYLLFRFRADVLPEGWETQPLVRQLQTIGTHAETYVLGFCEIGTGDLRLAFNYPGAFLQETRWADDSNAYSVVSPAPFGTPEADTESRAAVAFGNIYFYMYRFNHLFAVSAKTGTASKVLSRDTGQPGNPKFGLDGPIFWRRSTGEMIVRSDDQLFVRIEWKDDQWRKGEEYYVTEDHRYGSSFTSDGRSLVGVSQSPTLPPDIFLTNLKTTKTILLTELNPEYRNITLGQTENIDWFNRYGSKCAGLLIKPVGYQVGKRYPLIFMATYLDDHSFVSDMPYTTAFAPESLANAGFIVLMAKYPSENKMPQGEIPGEMSDAYNWMSMVESAIDLMDSQGMADRDNVGIVGFSRTSWLTDFTLTHSTYKFRAASSADGGIYTYGGYFRYNRSADMQGDETQIGGPPYDETFKLWLKYATPFNASRVTAPILMEYTGTAETGMEFFVALSRLGKAVEMYRYPNGEHPLDTPFERVASLQRNVDWFRFWMQGYERQSPQDSSQYVRWRSMHCTASSTHDNCSARSALDLQH